MRRFLAEGAGGDFVHKEAYKFEDERGDSDSDQCDDESTVG